MQSLGGQGGALQAEADDGSSSSEGAPAEEGHNRRAGEKNALAGILLPCQRIAQRAEDKMSDFRN